MIVTRPQVPASPAVAALVARFRAELLTAALSTLLTADAERAYRAAGRR